MESFEGDGDETRGRNGPLAVQTVTPFPVLSQAFVDASREMGYRVGDYNTESADIGLIQLTAKNGVRGSTRRAYLEPVMYRTNLRVICYATVTKILVNDEKIAHGVVYEKDGQTHVVEAHKEVILSASAIR